MLVSAAEKSFLADMDLAHIDVDRCLLFGSLLSAASSSFSALSGCLFRHGDLRREVMSLLGVFVLLANLFQLFFGSFCVFAHCVHKCDLVPRFDEVRLQVHCADQLSISRAGVALPEQGHAETRNGFRAELGSALNAFLYSMIASLTFACAI